MAERTRTARTWLGRLFLLALVGLLGLLTVQVMSGRYQVRPILSGSMRPGFAVGGVVVAQRVPVSSLAVRDVIIFHKPTDPNAYVVHRILTLTRSGDTTVIETKGDNNPVKDPWKVSLRGNVAYRATYTIPLVGYAALWLHDPSTRRYALFLAAGLLVAAAGVVLLRKKEPGTKEPAASSEHEPAASSEHEPAASSEHEPAASSEHEPAALREESAEPPVGVGRGRHGV